MEVSLGRHLSSDEEADHINDDRTDDRLENLQVLSRRENLKKSGKVPFTLICPTCGEVFRRKRTDSHLSRRQKYPSCCSRSCAAKYQYRSRVRTERLLLEKGM